MELNIVAVIVSTLVMFAVGAFWYSVPFQKAWSSVHGFDKLSKKEQDVLMKSMGPIYGVQLIVTVIMSIALTVMAQEFDDLPLVYPAFFIWLGFVMPSQVSAVLFSRTENRFKLQQILIMTSESLIRLLIAAWVVARIV